MARKPSPVVSSLSQGGSSCSFAKRLLFLLRYMRAKTGAMRHPPDHFKCLRGRSPLLSILTQGNELNKNGSNVVPSRPLRAPGVRIFTAEYSHTGKRAQQETYSILNTKPLSFHSHRRKPSESSVLSREEHSCVPRLLRAERKKPQSSFSSSLVRRAVVGQAFPRKRP